MGAVFALGRGLEFHGQADALAHQVDLELTSHGYGIVDVRPERVVNEVWYSPILAPADAETFGGAYAVRRGANRFDRTRITTPSPSR